MGRRYSVPVPGPGFWAVLVLSAATGAWLRPQIAGVNLPLLIVLALPLASVTYVLRSANPVRLAPWIALAMVASGITVVVETEVISGGLSVLTLWAILSAVFCGTLACRYGSGRRQRPPRIALVRSDWLWWVALAMAVASGPLAGQILAAAGIGSAAEIAILATLASVIFVGYRTQALLPIAAFWAGCLVVPAFGAASGDALATLLPITDPLSALGCFVLVGSVSAVVIKTLPKARARGC